MPQTPPPASASESQGNTPSLETSIPYDRFLDCVHCGLCTSACPTYLETGNENDSPRGRIYLMRAVTDGRIEIGPTTTRHLELCLDCRSCETACPSGVQYGRLIEPFRVAMQQDANGKPVKKDWFQRWILYGLFPYPQRLRLSLLPVKLMQWTRIDRLVEAIGLMKLMPRRLRRMHALLPSPIQDAPRLPESLPAIGTKRAKVALFTGCVADAMFRRVHWATAKVLQANGCEVVIPRSQVCCGAIHYHSGAGEPALQLARDNAAAFPDDVDAVIINVAGCGSMLKDYGHIAEEIPTAAPYADELSRFAHKVKDVHEFLASLGPVAPNNAVPMKAAYHDACHLVHAQRIREQPRNLLSLVPELQLMPLAESDICCGAAGSYNLTEPEMADRLGQRKLNHIVESGAEAVLCGNAGCTLQIQSKLREAGHRIPVLHPMEVLAQAYADT